MNDIKVSVVVAVYNAKKYIENTVKSITDQALKEIEIILVDDGSSDGSFDILKELEKTDERIRVLSQKEPSDGAALARNLGIMNASGEYVSVLDSDDFFEPDMLLKAYKFAKDKNTDIVIFDGDIYDESINTFRETGMILRKEYLPKEPTFFSPKENADGLFFMTIGSAWNCLFKRELIEREGLRFQSFYHADDLGFVYLGFATANGISVLPERLIHYRCNNPNSQAANLEKWPEAAAGAFIALKTELEKRKIFDTYRVTFTEMALHYFDMYLNRMPSYDSFEKLYLEWKNKYVKELGLDIISDVEFKQKRLKKVRDYLTKLEPGEYVFEKEHKTGLFTDNSTWKREIKPGSRIIVYGAGKRGKELFRDIVENENYHISGWVDKNYKEIGYPVIGLDDAINNDYDHILISLESAAVAEKIRKDLVGLGIEEKDIIWAGEEI